MMASTLPKEKWRDTVNFPITLLEMPKTANVDKRQSLGFSGEGTTSIFKDIGELLYDYRLERIEAVSRKVETLEGTIQDIQNRLEKLTCSYEKKDIEIRRITYSQAKKEIADFFKDHHGKELNAADIQENLGIDIEVAMKACDQLEKEGKIKQA
ncbi:MAG: hypothetical protein WBR24_10955 [Desulfobacterales bacterium]|jgi:hypothetical protein